MSIRMHVVWVLAMIISWIMARDVMGDDSAAPPPAEVVARAIANLKSHLPEEIVAAAEIIGRTDDLDAWERLRKVLADPEKLSQLEAVSKDTAEDANSYVQVRSLLARILYVTARSKNEEGTRTLMWLVDQPAYRDTYNEKGSVVKPWRLYLVYNAFQGVPNASKELLEFYRLKLKLDNKTLSYDLKNRIMEALAAHGTAESVALFKEHLWRAGDPMLLIRHRNRYECLRLCLDVYRQATNGKYAHELLSKLFAKTFRVNRFEEIQLPQIEPKGKAEIAATLTLFGEFLKEHGKIPLTNDEIEKIQGLIKSIGEAATVPAIGH